MSYFTPMGERAREHRAEHRERHLTLLDFGTPRDDKRRQEILFLIQGYENDIALTKMAIAKLYEDLARLDRHRG